MTAKEKIEKLRPILRHMKEVFECDNLGDMIDHVTDAMLLWEDLSDEVKELFSET